MQIGSDIAVVALDKNVDVTITRHLKEHIDELLDRGCTTFILNFADVDYIDSSGLGIIIYLYRKLTKISGHISLVNVSDQVMRMLSYARILDVIPATGSISTRREKLSSAPPKMPHLTRVIKVPDDPSCMAQVRSQVHCLLEKISVSDRDIFDLVLAVGEALGNAFDHGHSQDGSTRIYVTLTSYDDRVVIEVADTGCGCAVEDDQLPTPSETRGRGIRLMYLLADSVEIAKRPQGDGTIVRLVKLV